MVECIREFVDVAKRVSFHPGMDANWLAIKNSDGSSVDGQGRGLQQKCVGKRAAKASKAWKIGYEMQNRRTRAGQLSMSDEDKAHRGTP